MTQDRVADIPWEEARQKLYDLAAEPELPSFLDQWAQNALIGKWREEMVSALEPDIVMYGPEPLQHILEDEAETWDEVMEFYRKYYLRLLEQRKQCERNFQRIATIEVMGPSVRAKHWPSGNTTPDRIREAVAKDKESRFFRGVTPELLTQVLIDVLSNWIDDYWAAPGHLFVDVDTSVTVGATPTGDTSHVRFDCDFSTRLAHAYPVSESEAIIDRHRRVSSEMLIGRSFL